MAGVPVATVTVETMDGSRLLEAAALVAPKGYRRCWWCCRGRLITDSDEAERAHRWATAPAVADPARWRREREHDVEDDVRAQVARDVATRGLGGSAAAGIASLGRRVL